MANLVEVYRGVYIDERILGDETPLTDEAEKEYEEAFDLIERLIDERWDFIPEE